MAKIYLKLTCTAVLWGGTFIAGRIIVTNVEPYSAAFLRFALAGIFLIPLAWKSEGRLPAVEKDQILPVLLLGATGIFLYNIFFFKGLKLIEAGRAALIIANNPVCVALLSACFFKEKLSLLKIVGIILSITGALIVISKGHMTDIVKGRFGWGEVYIFLCVLSWAAFALVGKTVLRGISPLASIAYASVVGGGLLFFPALIEGVLQNIFLYTMADWIGIFYLGFFGTVIGFVWFYDGIKALGPTRASIFVNIVPVSAVVLAFVILDEPLTSSLLSGTVLVTAGVYLTNAEFSSFRPKK